MHANYYIMNFNEVILSQNDRDIKVFKKIYPKIDDWAKNGINHWHFVYINEDIHQCVHISGYSDKKISKELNFEKVYNALYSKDYSDLLLLVTYYGHMCSEKLITKINQPMMHFNSFTEALFQDTSKGYLAYAHQFEQIYSALTGVTSIEATTFRKDWNKKKQDIIQFSRQIKFGKNSNLADYAHEYSFFEEGPFFLNANFRQAKILYESDANYNG